MQFTRNAILSALFVASGSAFAASAIEAPQVNQIVISYRDSAGAVSAQGVSDRKLRVQAALRRAGAFAQKERAAHGGSSVLTLSSPLTALQARSLAADMMSSNPDVLAVEPDVSVQMQSNPAGAPYSLEQNQFDLVSGINTPAAWDRSRGDGVTVAVIDSGVLPHRDLSGRLLPGYDFVSSPTTGADGDGRDSNASDPGDYCGGQASSWHGTHVAGIIAASWTGSFAVGVAPSARILPVRVLGACGGSLSDVADGLVWAAGGDVAGVPVNPTPARVLNLSLGGRGECYSYMQAAINKARSLGAVVVVSAGNTNESVSNMVPANCAGVITVAAVDRAAGRAVWSSTAASNFGPAVDVAAPGTSIRSLSNSGSTVPGLDAARLMSGTSMAAPHVAGVAALMLARSPSLTPDQIKTWIKTSARPYTDGRTDLGAGIVDAEAAVDIVSGAPATKIAETALANDSKSTAQSILYRQANVSGSISTTSGDFYKVYVTPGLTLAAALQSGDKSFAANLNLYLYEDVGGVLQTVQAGVNTGGGPEGVVSAKNTSGALKIYYLWVTQSSGGDTTYKLRTNVF